MYYTASPTADYERWSDEQEAAGDAADELQAAEQELMRDYFLHAAIRDVSKLAYWTAPYNKFNAADHTYSKAFSTVAEIMAESLDYEGGPTMADLMQLLADSARGEDVKARSWALVRRMADKYSEMNVE